MPHRLAQAKTDRRGIRLRQMLLDFCRLGNVRTFILIHCPEHKKRPQREGWRPLKLVSREVPKDTGL